MRGVYYRSPKLIAEITARIKKAPKISSHSPEAIERIRASKIGKQRTFTPEWIENLRRASIAAGCKPPSSRGRKWTEVQKASFSRAHNGIPRPYFQGAGNPNWRGGINPARQQFMASIEYKTWRRHVFQRDDFTCQACGTRGGNLEADHELPFSLYPDLRLEILNGRTLCKPCHRKTPTYGGRARSFQT
jgi:hypothetical protein